jgi:membrane-associated protease RseP (regulator of RpoE activity)
MLLPATFVTLAFAGGVFWEASATADESDQWSALVQLDFHRRVLLAGLPYALWVIAILGSHEMGHYLACRYYGIRATLPFFIPGVPPLGSFGAVIRIRSPIPHRRALFDVAAAGPIAGFAIALPVLLAGFSIAEPVHPSELPETDWNLGPPLVLWLVGDWMQEGPVRVNHLIGAGWVGMLVTSLNLFPVGQLDGGHAAYALGRRTHRRLTLLSLVALLTLIVFQATALRQFPAYVLWFAILIWMRDRHPRLLDEEKVSLGNGRRLLALVLLLMLLLSFIPLPFML